MTNNNTLHLVISSVSESLFDGPALSATLPGSSGECTILPNHQPFVTTLTEGVITVRMSNQTNRTFPIKSGVLEISGTHAVVLI